MSTNPTTTNTIFIAKKAPMAALAALGTMACGAFALYVAMGWAKIGFGGDVWPYLAGLSIFAVAATIIGGMRLATHNQKTSSDGGFALGMTLIVITIAATAITIWAISTGWSWSQFWLGALTLLLWGVATTIHLIHKFKS